MVLALKNKSAQCSFSAMFFEKDKSNKLFIANIEARKAYYFIIGDRSKPNFRSITKALYSQDSCLYCTFSHVSRSSPLVLNGAYWSEM